MLLSQIKQGLPSMYLESTEHTNSNSFWSSGSISFPNALQRTDFLCRVSYITAHGNETGDHRLNGAGPWTQRLIAFWKINGLPRSHWAAHKYRRKENKTKWNDLLLGSGYKMKISSHPVRLKCLCLEHPYCFLTASWFTWSICGGSLMAAQYKTKIYHIHNKNGAPLRVEKGGIIWL